MLLRIAVYSHYFSFSRKVNLSVSCKISRLDQRQHHSAGQLFVYYNEPFGGALTGKWACREPSRPTATTYNIKQPEHNLAEIVDLLCKNRLPGIIVFQLGSINNSAPCETMEIAIDSSLLFLRIASIQ